MYLIRHSERLDFAEEEKWKKSNRFKSNFFDTPLSENGFKIANDKINKILMNINKEDLGIIYSSPLTRCIETSLEFQKVIKNKYKILIPIKIEYGLTHDFNNQLYIFFPSSKIKIINNKLEYIKDSSKFIDKYLENNNIYKRYGKQNFDITYKSIVSIDSINNESSYINSINKKFSTILKISKKIDLNKFNILCTHGEVISYTKSFIEKKWNRDNISQFSGKKNYCSFMKINKKNNELFIDKMSDPE
jgi:hypothetical protein